MKKYFAIGSLFALVLLLASLAFSINWSALFTEAFYAEVEKTYGLAAKKRAKKWEKLLNAELDASEWRKLKRVNWFFNQQVMYQSDETLWKRPDYWASPMETIGQGKGDCEDYAIAKFFTLIMLGVPENKLRLMYVRQLDVDLPHMVLVYFEEPSAIPLVLDNYNTKLLPANKRPDLKPIYSFNGQGLWLAKAKGLGRQIKNSKGVSTWTQLLHRIERQAPASALFSVTK